MTGSPKRTVKKTKMLIRSDKALTGQIFGQIVRPRPDRRTGAKMGSIFAPGFHSAGDGMKATLVISPLRKGFRTFFGLDSSKGRGRTKKAPL